MNKPREIFTADEEATVVVAGEEQTLVAPRFDDEETLVARPVVPLDAVEQGAPTVPLPPAAAAPSRLAYAPTRLLPRRTMLFPLMLVSVLIGGVLGGAGLYLYQRQSDDAQPQTAAPAAATSQPEARNTTPNESSQPAPAPTGEAVSPAPDAQPSNAATDTPPADAEANATDASNAPAVEGRADSDGTGAAPAREAESVPASGAPKRGKKGAHDEEIERPTRRADRSDSGAPVARADADEGEARRVDTITYRPRRATRERVRRQTAGDIDRLRRIFEGSPE